MFTPVLGRVRRVVVFVFAWSCEIKQVQCADKPDHLKLKGLALNDV